MLGLIVAFRKIHQRGRHNRGDKQQEEGGGKCFFLRCDGVKQILQCGVVLREFQDTQQTQHAQHAQIQIWEQEVQIEGRCCKEIDQTKETEYIFLAAFPGAALLSGVACAIRPGSEYVFGREEHHAPELELMEKIFVSFMNLMHRIQHNCGAIGQHHNGDHPFKNSAGVVVRGPVQDLHDATFHCVFLLYFFHANAELLKTQAGR